MEKSIWTKRCEVCEKPLRSFNKTGLCSADYHKKLVKELKFKEKDLDFINDD